MGGETVAMADPEVSRQAASGAQVGEDASSPSPFSIHAHSSALCKNGVDLESKKVRLQDAFDALEAQRVALERFTLNWKELDDFWSMRESECKEKEAALAGREKALENTTKLKLQALERREAEITMKEAAAAQRVQELKDAAIAAVTDEKRKREVAIKAESEAETTRAPEKMGSAEVLVDSSNDGVAAPSKAEETAPAKVKLAVNGKSSGIGSAEKVTSEVAATSVEVAEGGSKGKGFAAAPPATVATAVAGVAVEGGAKWGPEVKVRPELTALCESMDGEGLLKLFLSKRKETPALRAELPAALQHAIDPASLVLSILESYPDATSGEKDTSGNGPAVRRVCITFLECLAPLAESGQGPKPHVVPATVQAVAKKVADRWIAAGLGPDEIATLDAQAILQLLATFGIAGQYSVDELCKYVTLIARRKQSTVLCHSLGLADKMPELVDRLAKEGKQVEALRFAHEFGIMDRVQPVPMLKGYLKEAKKAATIIFKNGNGSAAAQNESTVKEMGALRTVIRCIEEYGIEAHYPSSPLRKRMEQLEKAKADRKRAAVTLKAQTKRPRANDGPYSSSAGERERAAYRGGESARYGAGVIGSRPPYAGQASPSAAYASTVLYGGGQVATTYTGGGGGAMAAGGRNPELVRGVGKYSRSASYKRRGVWAVKAKNGGALPQHAKKEKVEEKAAKKAPRFYPGEDVKQPLKKIIIRKPTKLRSSITPGTVLILLAGQFKGKRVIFLKQLSSGLLLVSGPYKLNGVPLRRVNQRYVIATSTKIDISGVDVAKYDDAMFKKLEKKAKKGESEFFDEDSEEKVEVSEEKKEATKEIDSQLIPLVEAVPLLAQYMKTRFTLKAGQKPHEMAF